MGEERTRGARAHLDPEEAGRGEVAEEAGHWSGVRSRGGPLGAPHPGPAHLAALEMFVASDFLFEVSVVIIWLYYMPGSYTSTNNKLHFMEHLSFQRIAKTL